MSLAPYLPRIALDWMAEHPERTHRRFEGTLLFADVSGFTALTERLAARGKVGAEEITGVIGSVFGRLLGIAASYGADLLKWGGDAVLLYFAEPDSAQRAGRAALEMTGAMSRMKAFRTSAGRVNLAVSIGAHSGTFDLYLLGNRHRELVVTGPQASVTARMEAVADAGQVVISPQMAARLDPHLLGPKKGAGVLLVAPPDAIALTAASRASAHDRETDAAQLLPADTRAHLLGGGETSEHRQATVAFIEFSGLDALAEAGGAALVAEHLEPVVSAAAGAAERYLVNFKETDIGPDGGKIVIVGGVPKVRGHDAERVLRAVLDVVSNHPSTSPISLRAGVNFGRVFVFSHEFDLAKRQVFATTGDAMNLAARVMGKSAPGQVWATQAVLSRVRNPFDTEDIAPFAVKGKSAPVSASIVVAPRFGMLEATVEDALPFVGREPEISTLLAGAAGAVSGSGAVLEIVGPPGIGKSRLVSEAIDRWPLQTLRVPCEDYGSATPYLPFRRIFRVLLGINDTASNEAAEVALRQVVRRLSPDLEPYLPLLGDVAGIAVPTTPEVDELEGRFLRSRLERSVVQLIKAYLSGPSALVFEDAHSMDEASASLLEQIALEVGHLSLLIVLTRGVDRPGPIPHTISPTIIDLEPLAADAAADLAGTAAATLLPPAHLSAIVERAGGNPLFLRELLRSAKEAGGIEELPESLEPLLVAAIDLLDPPDRQILRAAAVLGARFDSGVLRQLVDGDTPVDPGALHRLAAFVVPAGKGWMFSHGLVRHAAYEGLSFKRRRELHSRAAHAIEAASAPNSSVELLSHHWMQAERFDRAWACSREAGDNARSLWANADAASFYDRALQAAAHLRLPPADVFDVAEALGDTSEVAARYEGARSAYLRARRLCRRDDDRARLLRKIGILYERQGRYREALNCYTRGRGLVEGAGGAAALERCELSLATAGIKERQGRYHESLIFAERAAQEAEEAGHRPGLAHALYLQQMISEYLGSPAEDLGHRSLVIYEELGDLVGQGNALNNLGISAYYGGQWGKALEFYERSREARIRSGDVVGAATEENNIAEILSDQGELDQARPLFESARATWTAAGYRLGAAFAVSNLGRLRARHGDIEAGTELLEAALEEFTAIKSVGSATETRLRLRECEVMAGEFASAAGSLRDLLDEVRGKPGYEQIEMSALRLVAVAETLGARPESRGVVSARSLDAAVEKAAALDNPYELALALATRSVLRGNGLIEGAAGTDEDPERALEVFRKLGVREAVITWSSEVIGAPLFAYRS